MSNQTKKGRQSKVNQGTRGANQNSEPKNKEPILITLKPSKFIEQFSEKLKELLSGIIFSIDNKELDFETEYADDYIDEIIDRWCELTEPSTEDNIEMMAAVFLLTILNEAYGDDIEESQQLDVTSLVTIEILKTIREIFGKKK